MFVRGRLPDQPERAGDAGHGGRHRAADRAPLLLRFGAALPSWGLPAIAVTGTVVNTVLVASCTTPYGAALNSFAYLWIGIYAGQFFGQREVRIQCAVIVVASGVALWLSALPGMATAWVLVAGSSVLASEALARLNGRLRRQLVTDPLTGLLNRAGFAAAAERLFALAGREGLAVSVALIDLDEFKLVNDRHGHAAGDEMLVDLGHSWGRLLRGSEVLARLGGDEFALVLAGSDRQAADEALRRLHSASPVGWSAAWSSGAEVRILDRALARADQDSTAPSAAVASSAPLREWKRADRSRCPPLRCARSELGRDGARRIRRRHRGRSGRRPERLHLPPWHATRRPAHQGGRADLRRRPEPHPDPGDPRNADRLGAHATFFEEGRHVAGREALMRQILAAGDEIGNHSFHHPVDPGFGGARLDRRGDPRARPASSPASSARPTVKSTRR